MRSALLVIVTLTYACGDDGWKEVPTYTLRNGMEIFQQSYVIDEEDVQRYMDCWAARIPDLNYPNLIAKVDALIINKDGDEIAPWYNGTTPSSKCTITRWLDTTLEKTAFGHEMVHAVHAGLGDPPDYKHEVNPKTEWAIADGNGPGSIARCYNGIEQ